MQVDADGQHCLSDTPKLLAAAEQNPEPLFAAGRNTAMMRPKHGFTDAKLPISGICCTLGHATSKTACAASASIPLHPRYPSSARNRRRPHGLRHGNPYPPVLARRQASLDKRPSNTPPTACPISIAFADNVRISKMHTRLFFGMLKHRLGKVSERPSETMTDNKQTHWAAQPERGSRLFLALTTLMVRYLPAFS